MINILSFSTNHEILTVMDRLISNHDNNWRSHCAADLEAARRVLTEENIEVVLLGAGTGEAEHTELQTLTETLGKAPKFVYHYGGGSGLLYAEVNQVTE